MVDLSKQYKFIKKIQIQMKLICLILMQILKWTLILI